VARGERPAIPPNMQKELWARAAGRCEFRGCNRLVFRDGLTKQRSNLSVISHIVAVQPGGPRGDPVRSPALCKDISNLMLTCRDHAKVVDDASLVDQYPESLLSEFKREHEERIQRVTGIAVDAQSRIYIVQAPVNGRLPAIPERDVALALLPRYPADERATVCDLNSFGQHICSPDGLRLAAQVLGESVGALQTVQLRDRKHLSVFALAPIPLLVYLGRRLGDLDDLDAYQRHRATASWTWAAEEKPQEYYKVESDNALASEVVVLLSVSARVAKSLAMMHVPPSTPVIEVRARKTGVDFLRSRSRLDAFALAARELMGRLHEEGVTKVHVFAAAPSPVAIEFGRAARDLSGKLVAYEYDEGRRSYGASLSV
jgi:hypothetical protein